MSKSKAKPSAAVTRQKPLTAPRRAVPFMGDSLYDPQTGALYDARTRKLLPPPPPTPPPTPEQIKAEKAARAARRQRHEERRAAFHARIARRPSAMQGDGYRLPTDVAAFLRRLHREPSFYYEEVQISTAQAKELIEAAYMDGCRQGFIEGFLYGEDKARPGALKNRERLRQQNLEKLARLGIADRNAQIVAEFHQMERGLPGKEQRYEELAARHELTTRQIGNIIRKASTRRR